MFKTRLISGVILVAAAIVIMHFGGMLLLAVCAVISLIGLFEFYRAFGIHSSAPAVIGYIGAAAWYLNLAFTFAPELLILLAVLIAMLCAMVFRYPDYHPRQIFASFFGVIYVAVMLSFVWMTRDLDGGRFLVWLVFLCSWGCDTSAYCFGKLFGRHKMSPKLSPKKSVEGAVGGVIGAFVLTVIYGFIFRHPLGADVTAQQILLIALISAAGGLISMVGDLSASAIKRNYDIKDYGQLIPGHGGILDRFDSVIFTAPVIFYLLTMVPKL